MRLQAAHALSSLPNRKTLRVPPANLPSHRLIVFYYSSWQMEKTANAPEESHVDEGQDGKEVDIYDTNLTREEIQKIVNVINATAAAERKQAASTL